ncbi:GNAT family N-acetyltransferase [Bacillus sp. M6-12]|uniref:GNAT family N-acetyltransferase n=1 Tax=Bacillus sp. M6-12 TaxID=2054166 RepID=UPI0015E0F948|nr:GNAT family N-acetyltransferase [Bacillus sp. M6-12]
MYKIETIRLGFVPITIEALEAAAELGEQGLEQFLGLKIIKGFIEPIHKERIFPIRMEKLRKDPEISKWYGFVVEKETHKVVGMMGYKSPPDEKGFVEIGYGIHRRFQGLGYASEMAQALRDWAFLQPDVKAITATNILNDNHSSIKIVEKIGMELIQRNENTMDYIVYK